MGNSIKFQGNATRKLIDKTKEAALIGVAGKGWYKHAQGMIAFEANRQSIPCYRFADILAVTSPRVHVKKNWMLASRYVRNGSQDGMMQPVRAALAHYEATGEIRGPKTSAFSKALQGDTQAVVLDVWMAAFYGVEQQRFSLKHGRDRYEDAIRKAAQELGWEPAEVQAAVWTYQVKHSGNHVGSFVIQQELEL